MFLLSALILKGAAYIPPPAHLPQIDGASFPGFYQIFRGGECDAEDAGLRINPAKRCYSCFRIPALVRNPKTGTLYAFSEARRGGLFPDSCPDVPDTKVAFKRSTDGGATWSDLRILEGNTAGYNSQASPVVDESTGHLHVLFNRDPASHTFPFYMNSTDDGITFSIAQRIIYKQPSIGQITLSTNAARGHYLSNGSSVRLVFPGQFGAIYSDDRGATWSCKHWEQGMGEAQFTRCNPPSVCQGHAFAATFRVGRGTNIAFSDDMVNWGPMRPLNTSRFSNYSQAAGFLGVPGALLLSHGGSPGMSGLGVEGKGDSGGMNLLWSEDSVNWKLLRRLWPLRSGYSTMAELEVDAKGNVVTYAVVFEGADLLRVDAGLIFENFTWVKPTHELLV